MKDHGYEYLHVEVVLCHSATGARSLEVWQQTETNQIKVIQYVKNLNGTWTNH